jgi:formylglycine-generating enzyme required for sulfatase activity
MGHVFRITLALAGTSLAPAARAQNEAVVDFAAEIQPIIESACLSCHNETDAQGALQLDSLAAALAGGDTGPAIVPGKPDESTFYTYTVVASDDDLIMPPEGPPLAKLQTDRIRDWIAQGAKWPEDAKLRVRPRIDFVKHVQPILEQHCVACHSPELAEGDFDLSTRQAAFETGNLAPSIIPFQPVESFLYELTVAEEDDEQLMPPANAGGPLDEELTERLRLWIAQGAVWPDGVTLTARARVEEVIDTPDTMDLVKKIHELIVARSQEKSASEMADYTGKIPRTGAAYQMVAIPGGEILMGSPESEPHRQASEGPQVKVTISPFWIGKFEVTWDEYEPFMLTRPDRHKHGARMDYDENVHDIVDAVSQPTKPYMEMSFGMGQYGYPAISMTQHAANKYCQWLSAQTGHFYRLPTEAEWEYACRAGTTTAWSCGDDPAQLGEYAWYYDNANDQYEKVGHKKPNPWGLYDMHGNVREWTADQFVADYFLRIQDSAVNPFIKPQTLYPRSVRGGGWDDDPQSLRSAARVGSDPEWKRQDPQLPKSIWYHTDARSLGFRIVRPLEVPTVEEMNFYWNSASGMRDSE